MIDLKQCMYVSATFHTIAEACFASHARCPSCHDATSPHPQEPPPPPLPPQEHSNGWPPPAWPAQDMAMQDHQRDIASGLCLQFHAPVRQVLQKGRRQGRPCGRRGILRASNNAIVQPEVVHCPNSARSRPTLPWTV